MEMVMALMTGITTTAPKVEEMSRATQLSLLLAGENPEVEVEDVDDHQFPGEFLQWESIESIESHVSITGRIRIPSKRTRPKWNHTIVSGGNLHLGQTAPLKSTIVHPLTAPPRNTRVTGAHLSMATHQVIGHLLQDNFGTTQLTEGQALHQPSKGLSEATKGSQVFLIMINIFETLAQEEGPMNTQGMA